ncbi:MAG: phosphosulfolactate synthase [Acidimicrobiales bacterium]|nr:phosphosulfolactate synthase [Acidimicrobiales bacterium]
MDSIFLDLPARNAKPRSSGLTMAIDNGIPHGAFADAMASGADYVDVVKFGWGTALVTPDVERKFEVLRQLGIGYYFGGTLFEKFVQQERFESFLTLCRLCGCRYVEISNGTIDMSLEDKAYFIKRCAEEFTVLSEVGFKDADRSSALTAEELLDAIHADAEAGASYVITEARESGRSGICRPDGTPRDDLVDAILSSDIESDHLIFEAPTKDLQTHFIKLLGTNVNLGNIAPCEVIGLETLRLGLRADTLMHFEQARSCA